MNCRQSLKFKNQILVQFRINAEKFHNYFINDEKLAIKSRVDVFRRFYHRNSPNLSQSKGD